VKTEEKSPEKKDESVEMEEEGKEEVEN